MKSCVVLGAGMVGSAIARDLALQYQVTSVDMDMQALEKLSKVANIKTKNLNLNDKQCLQEIVKDCDLVISAVPGNMGYSTLESVIQQGKNIVDISFFPENALQLDDLAKQNAVTAVVDMGVAPGMGNLILGYCDSIMEVESFECLVGGLPTERILPFEYKAPFSPCDVVEEYTRPAKLKENGKVITRPALSDPETINFAGIGSLEAFNTDGLRSLLKTMPHIPNMKEKTLRYPGHIRLIETLKSIGFLNEGTINVNGVEVAPRALTEKLLFNAWKLNPEDKEFTVMRVKVKGKENHKNRVYEYHLYDETDRHNNVSSMARTTGFACTAVVNWLMQESSVQSGVVPPEYLGADQKCYDFIFNYLQQRDVVYLQTVTGD